MKILSPALPLPISIILTLMFGVGCGGGPVLSDSPSYFESLSTPPDSRIFSPAEITVERVVQSWSFVNPADVEQWEVTPESAIKSVDRQGLRLNPGNDLSTPIALTTPVDFPAQDISVIEVTFNYTSHVNSLLYWAGPDEGFSRKRRTPVSETSRKNGQVRVARFHVNDVASWKGNIRHLKIEPALETKTEYSILSVAAVEVQVMPNLVDSARQRPWKVDFDHTLRDSVVAFPDRPWINEVTVQTEGTTLNFVPGLPNGVTERVKFAVHLLEKDGTRQELFARNYGGNPKYEPGWQKPVSVSLDSFKGQKIRLAFEVTGIKSIRRKIGLAAWGNLQLTVIPRDHVLTPNIVFICLDTVRADHLSTYGYGRQTTPNIDRWAAKRGVVFETAVAPSPWTLPSHISMFTGLDAIRHGANYRLPARAEFEMIAEKFADKGYETIAWTGGGYLGPGYALHQGFETYHYWLGPKQREIGDNVRETIEWLSQKRERPFFLFLHTYEVHEPYFERQPFYDRFAAESGRPRIPSNWVASRRIGRGPEDGFLAHKDVMMSPDHGQTWDPIPPDLKDGVIDRYDAGLAFTDAQIGKVLDAVESLGHAEDTIVLLTSDHGEALGEHGLSGHVSLYDFNILVPLIIAAPGSGWPQGHRVSQQVRSIDIAPTLLDLAGFEVPDDIDGETLSSLLGDDSRNGNRSAWSYAASANRGIALRTEEKKYIFNNTAWSPAFGGERFYDLSADRSESVNVANNHLGKIESLRKSVTDRLSREAVGVWIHIQNPTDKALTLELSGKGVASPTRLKAVVFPGAGMEYLEGDEPRAVAEIPGHSKALLYSEVTEEAQISVNPQLQDGPPGPRWRMRVRDVRKSPWSVRLVGNSWIEKGGDIGTTEVAVMIFTSGAFGVEASPETMTEEIQDQLKALGYIE